MKFNQVPLNLTKLPKKNKNHESTLKNHENQTEATQNSETTFGYYLSFDISKCSLFVIHMPKKLYWCIRGLIFGDAPTDLHEKVLIFCDLRAKIVHFSWLPRKKRSILAKVLIFRNIQTCCASALHLDLGSWYRQLYKYNILSIIISISII